MIAKPSVQSLYISMFFNSQVLATGTSFAVNTADGPYLVTNRHNVTGRNPQTGEPLSKTCGIPNRLEVVHNRKGRLGEWVVKNESLERADGTPRWIEHPRLGEKVDFVALKLTDLSDVELYPYDPAGGGADIFLGPADPVSVIGFPFGLTAGGAFGVWATGFLASEAIVDFDGLPIQLIDCRARQGQSGSPVIAYRSGGAVKMSDGSTAVFDGPVERFLGIYSGRVNAESDLGIVWKASAIAELIAHIKP